MPSVTNDWLVPFQPDEIQPHGLIYALGYLWIALESDPGILIRMDPNNPSAYQRIVFPDVPFQHQYTWAMDIVYIAAKGKIYVAFGRPAFFSGTYTQVAKVVEVDPTTLAWHDVVSDTSYNPEQTSLTADANWIYVLARVNNRIYRYSLTTWAAGGFLDLPLSFPHCARYDSVTDRIYVTTSDYPDTSPLIVSINPNTFAIDQIGSFSLNPNTILTDDMAMTPDHIWCGSERTGNVLKISKANLSDITVIYLPTAPASVWSMYFDGTWIWVGTKGSPGTIIRIDPVTLDLTSYVFPDPSQGSPNEIWGNVPVEGQPATTLFFTFYNSPGAASAMTVAASITTIVSPTAAAERLAGGTPTITIGGAGAITTVLSPSAASEALHGGTPTVVISPRVFSAPAVEIISGRQPTVTVTATDLAGHELLTGGSPVVVVTKKQRNYSATW